MRWFAPMLLTVFPCLAVARLEIVPDEMTQAVFAGGTRRVQVVFHNPTDQLVEAELKSRLLQASSATVIPLGEEPWKRLRVLPGQTVLESVRLRFPAVKAETLFLVQWVDANRRVLGLTEVMIYPTNLFTELKTLAGEKALGVFDPDNRLKPWLAGLKMEFEDLERTELENFAGKLVLFGPFSSKEQMPACLARRIAARCKGGLRAVWMQPPAGPQAKFQPSFYPVQMGKGTVVVAEASIVADLAANPLAHLNLVRLARLAVRPTPFTLPGLEPGD